MANRYEDSDGPFGIWCRVSGGITGTREAWLKRNDERAEFGRYVDAAAEAARLHAQANGPHARASFSYTAKPLE